MQKRINFAGWDFVDGYQRGDNPFKAEFTYQGKITMLLDEMHTYKFIYIINDGTKMQSTRQGNTVRELVRVELEKLRTI